MPDGGRIINIGSVLGERASTAGISVYNASKFAVVGLSEAMRSDLAAYDIGVSVLCPGLVATNIVNSERNRPDADDDTIEFA